MLVDNFRLLLNNAPVRFVKSPNVDELLEEPLFVVMHYTGGTSLSSAVGWLSDPASQVSSHLVIGRNGEVVQLVPFNFAAWHAGVSEWKGYTRLNRYSIGIELDNAGLMRRSGSQWISSFGAFYPDSEVVAAAHKATPTVTFGWQKYPEAQLAAAAEVVAALTRAYGIREIVGHDDIAPTRKWDPGPAFPMEKFRQDVAALVSGGGGEQPGGGSPSQPETLPASGERHFRLENLESGKALELTSSTSFKPAMLLSVPYVSQLGTGADAHRNDCGAAAAIMLLRAYLNDFTLTPDEFYTRFAVPGADPYLSVIQIRNAMGSLGLLTDFKAGLSFQDLFGCLAAGKPLIVLMRYKVLEEAGLTEKHFEGPHFAVAVGIDIRNIYIHDPLYTNPADGEAHAYPLDLFWKAWKEVATDPKVPNPECSAIIPTAGIGFKMSRMVKVNAPALTARAALTPNAPVTKRLLKGEVVEIVREMGGWGELAGGGWLYLAYTVAA